MKSTLVYCFLAVVLLAGTSNSENTVCNTSSFVADPEDCTKFYICDHGDPVSQECPDGLHWNRDLNICDWPLSAGCQKG